MLQVHVLNPLFLPKMDLLAYLYSREDQIAVSELEKLVSNSVAGMDVFFYKTSLFTVVQLVWLYSLQSVILYICFNNAVQACSVSDECK